MNIKNKTQGGKNMPETLVVCTKCKAEFPSPISFNDRKSFETSMLSENVTTCLMCGATISCNKENMIFKD